MGAYETQGFKLDNTGRRIVVDPVTRIEGHMRCEVNVDKDNIIRNAVSTGTTTCACTGRDRRQSDVAASTNEGCNPAEAHVPRPPASAPAPMR